jgi:hypothetical protein
VRIQILPLPSIVRGDDMEEPFALVFDQIEDDAPKLLLYEFARQCGAKTHVMVPQTVEIVDPYAETPLPPEPPMVQMEPPQIRGDIPELARIFAAMGVSKSDGTDRLRKAALAEAGFASVGDAELSAHTYKPNPLDPPSAQFCLVCCRTEEHWAHDTHTAAMDE